jgi:hypothetical protein
MVECVLAWTLLFAGIATREAGWFIASGVFAIALQISIMREGKTDA